MTKEKSPKKKKAQKLTSLKDQKRGFLKQFFLNYKSTGAIAASSKKLGHKFIESSNLENANKVVELGSGDGVLTEQILNHLNPKAEFFAMEVNPYFVKQTQARCPGATVYQDSAHNIKQYLRKEGMEGFDCIISGLPWSLFSKAFQETLLEEIFESLNPGGEFLTFAYIHGLFLPSGRVYRKRLPGKFREVKRSKIVWKNAPPALVYKAIK